MYLAPDEIQEIDGRPYPTSEVLRSVFVARGRGLVKRGSLRPAPASMSFDAAGAASFRLPKATLIDLYYGNHPSTSSRSRKSTQTKKRPSDPTALIPPPKAVFKRGARYYPSQTYLKQIFTGREGALLWQPKYWARRRKIQVEGRVTMFIRGKNRSYSAETLRNIYFLNRVSTPKHDPQTNQSIRP